ncbi:hypothetical protein ACM66B_001205 [Microbotryomycetes sp. NB124-2]
MPTAAALCRFRSSLAVWVLLASYLAVSVQAHIQLFYPPPIRSKFDPQTPESMIDYSMTSPLLADGSNYPCKGYTTPSAYSTLNSVATLEAGKTFNVTLDGTAVHGGGSCQFSVSYDQGKTFAVIASIIGGCPIGLQFSVPIPSSLPSAKKATFAWTWFNLIGNREEYMNCAIVDIKGSSSSSYTGPTLFRANTFADNTCITVEGEEVVFPNPGPSVQYFGTSTRNSKPTVLDNCPHDQDRDVTVPAGTSSVSSSSSSTTSTVAASSSSVVSSQSVIVTTSSAASTSSATSSASRSTTTTTSASSSASKTTVASSTTTSKTSTSSSVSKTSTTSSRSATTSSKSTTSSKPVVTSTSTTKSSTNSRASTSSKTSSTTKASSTTKSSTTSRVSTSSRSSTSTVRSSTSTRSSSAASSTSIRSSSANSSTSKTSVSSTSTTLSASSASSTSSVSSKTSSVSSSLSSASTTSFSTSSTVAASSASSATRTSSSVVSSAASSTTAGPPAPTSTPDLAYLRCDSLTTWSLCGDGTCTFMGAVAPGTECRDGQIVMAQQQQGQRLIKRNHTPQSGQRRRRHVISFTKRVVIEPVRVERRASSPSSPILSSSKAVPSPLVGFARSVGERPSSIVFDNLGNNAGTLSEQQQQQQHTVDIAPRAVSMAARHLEGAHVDAAAAVKRQVRMARVRRTSRLLVRH